MHDGAVDLTCERLLGEGVHELLDGACLRVYAASTAARRHSAALVSLIRIVAYAELVMVLSGPLAGLSSPCGCVAQPQYTHHLPGFRQGRPARPAVGPPSRTPRLALYLRRSLPASAPPPRAR